LILLGIVRGAQMSLFCIRATMCNLRGQPERSSSRDGAV